jgi:hypothetical protein
MFLLHTSDCLQRSSFGAPWHTQGVANTNRLLHASRGRSHSDPGPDVGSVFNACKG